MSGIVTIKDVALHAGVAVSTVSRVINNMDRVSPDTREMVMMAVEELGYVRNNLAASIKTGSTHFIVTIVPDIINEFYTAVIRGVEEVARAKGYYTLVYAANEEKPARTNVFSEEFCYIVDGVIVVPSTVDETIIRGLHKPMVTIDRELPGYDGCSVTVDNYKGACLLTQELIDYGHRKIAFVTGNSKFNVTGDRMHGFLDTLLKNHIPVRKKYICLGDWYQEAGYAYAERLMRYDDPPTAIFAGNNQICIGCAKYLLSQGLEIGKDISLVEFDDSEVAQFLGAGITSLNRPTFEMGRIGAKMLFSMLEHGESAVSKRKIQLDVELIRRKSVSSI